METKTSANNGKALTKKAAGTTPQKSTIPMFTIVKDGNQFAYKIANPQHPLVCRRRGIIQVEAIVRNAKKQPNVTFRNYKDASLGVWYGIPMGINDTTKKIIWQSFTLGDFREYDLTKEDDAIEWMVLSKQPFLKGSVNEKGRLLYKIYDTEELAKEEVKKAGLVQRAISIAYNMKPAEKISVVRQFGKNPEGMSTVMLDAAIMKLAQDTPFELLNYWEDHNRVIVDLFNAAKAIGIISYEHDKAAWMYKRTLNLGIMETGAIAFLAKDASLATGIKMEVEMKDRAIQSVQQRTDDYNFEESEGADDDLVELRMKAKALGISGWDVKKEAELTSEIEEKEEDGGVDEDEVFIA